MHKNILLILTFISVSFSQNFETYFLNTSMRVDYFHTGTKDTESFSIDKIYEEKFFAGNKNNLIDNLNLGEYLFQIFDAKTNTLIFSKGFSSIFQEWQTTDEAINGNEKTFHETIRFPFPKDKILLTISRRNKFVGDGNIMQFGEIFSTSIDPNSNVSKNIETKNQSFEIFKNGNPNSKVDIVIIGDGYSNLDKEKFLQDANRFANSLFATYPFSKHKDKFNIIAVETISENSGIDKPDKEIFKNTILGTTYNFFGSARYVLSENNKSIYDAVQLVPYDAIAILVNDDRYGGGGIYNLYTTCYTKTDNPEMEWQMDYVFVHEFGHSFAGLGDEYYSSQVSYNDFYKKNVEPWEPNITQNTNRQTLKWKNFINDDTPIPTLWKKNEYDSLGKERSKLNRLANDYYEKRKPLYEREQEILKTSKYKNEVGLFEGAGYISNGMYRPSIDCRMFSVSLVDFDAVCSKAIEETIDFYTK